MHRLIHFAFHQFYTTFAWTYDGVAAAMSFGEWKAWGEAALNFVPAHARVLEIAHGPGHLHLTMRQRGLNPVSFDLSAQMSRQLLRRVKSHGLAPRQLRADAQRLPFADGTFDCVLSTFPAGFIFASATLAEVRRVLVEGGRFIIVPNAVFRSTDLPTRLVQLAYAITGQNATAATTSAGFQARFEAAGFTFESHIVSTRRADVTVWVCSR